MKEFEDSLSIIDALGKDFRPVNRDLPASIKDDYNYIEEKYLFTKKHMTRLRDKAKEMYIDQLYFVNSNKYDDEEFFTPSAEEISDLIDYENMELIRSFFQLQKDMGESDIDEIIIAYYMQNNSYQMTNIIEDLLLSEGFVTQDGLEKIYDKTGELTEADKRFFDNLYAPQTIMFYELLY